MEKVRKFLEELKNDPKAVERLRAEVPKSFEEFLKLLAAEAKKLGHEVSESELGAFYADALKERAAKSDAAEKIVSEADDELGAVAGGEEAGSAEASTLRYSPSARFTALFTLFRYQVSAGIVILRLRA